ncbi:MAG: hypothetical protein K2L24_00490 [Opitutales bacterium]|nr:hypothetical protein [Opitutales bacterium]
MRGSKCIVALLFALGCIIGFGHPKILIYDDEGVDPQSLADTIQFFKNNTRPFCYRIQTITSQELCQTSWERRTKLLVFPGGRDILYDRRLRGPGCKKIKAFVHNGGCYLGICAEAYFAGQKVVFAPGTDLEVIEDRELGFFPGITLGPILPAYTYGSEAGSCAARLHFKPLNTEFFTYYNGGGTFVPQKAQNYKVLATYSDADNLPAIVQCSVGKGIAILSGVHFECDLEALRHYTDTPKKTEAIIRAIQSTDAQQTGATQWILKALRL